VLLIILFLFPVKNLSKLEFSLVLRTYCVFCPRPWPRDLLPWPWPYLAFHFSPLVTSVVAASTAVQNLLIHWFCSCVLISANIMYSYHSISGYNVLYMTVTWVPAARSWLLTRDAWVSSTHWCHDGSIGEMWLTVIFTVNFILWLLTAQWLL